MPTLRAIVDLVAGVHGERDHAVDIAGRQAGVVERGADRLARQLQLAAPGFLGELGLADPGDGRGCRRSEPLMRRLRRAG